MLLDLTIEASLRDRRTATAGNGIVIGAEVDATANVRTGKLHIHRRQMDEFR